MKKSDAILVTGGAGFIGSNLVRHLNNAGYENILIVDDLSDVRKLENLKHLSFAYEDISDFEAVNVQYFKFVFHLGAISSTACMDAKLLMKNNDHYTKQLLTKADRFRIPIHYASSASVYGNEKDGKENPLNPYAFSKWATDMWVKKSPLFITKTTKVVGFRYFNVYGPNEYHKDGQCSPVLHFVKQAYNTNEIKVFDVSSRRDFVHVDDICKIHIWLMENNPDACDIIDVGTGQARSFREMAEITALALPEVRPLPINTVPFPKYLKGKYQYHTQANLERLRALGYKESLLTIEEGVPKYVRQIVERKNSDLEI